ncbi:MFS transporter [Paractinoplanes rishiriensis]|uniref:MFS transporter n=1 Tax=Paractinoplanes rishiriensis TaxID=1050105 RepID=A0A919JX49_9ACTN|nr:MFS transporter [Actinoplanes rishiriensis]GIE96841.1 MFS transporter [Actinoplanes rishiriensis]
MRRNAVLFVLISLLSGFGSTAMTLAAGIWVYDLTDSPGLAALTGLCIYAPTLAAPWLGALVDRLPRRPLLIWTDLLLGVVLLSLLTVSGPEHTWLIFAVLLVRGISYVLVDAGETAILPAALPASALGDINGWRTSAQEGMKLLAPLAGAGLYAWQGPVPVVLLSAAMPALTAACYGLLRVTSPAPRDGRKVAAGPVAGEREIWAGLVALFGNPAVRVPVLMAAVAIALSGLTNAAVIERVVGGLGLPATHLGFLSTAQGAGSIVGGLVAGRLLARFAPVGVAAIGAAVFAGGCLAWCLPWWPALVVGSVLVGVGLPWTLIAGVTAVQTRTPDHLLGRVGASSTTVMFGPVALAIPLGSAVLQLGALVPLLVAAVVAFAVAGTQLRGKSAGQRADVSAAVGGSEP